MGTGARQAPPSGPAPAGSLSALVATCGWAWPAVLALRAPPSSPRRQHSLPRAHGRGRLQPGSPDPDRRVAPRRAAESGARVTSGLIAAVLQEPLKALQVKLPRLRGCVYPLGLATEASAPQSPSLPLTVALPLSQSQGSVGENPKELAEEGGEASLRSWLSPLSLAPDQVALSSQ